MKVIRLDSIARQILDDDDVKLAATLRRVASEVERGEVRQLIMTLIRSDGTIERLGNVSSTTQIS